MTDHELHNIAIEVGSGLIVVPVGTPHDHKKGDHSTQSLLHLMLTIHNLLCIAYTYESIVRAKSNYYGI
jgi:hypothetical protein